VDNVVDFTMRSDGTRLYLFVFSTNETSLQDERTKKASGTDAWSVAMCAKTAFTFRRNVWWYPTDTLSAILYVVIFMGKLKPRGGARLAEKWQGGVVRSVCGFDKPLPTPSPWEGIAHVHRF